MFVDSVDCLVVHVSCCLVLWSVVLVIIRVEFFVCMFVFQAEDGIRYLVRSRGLGDVYKRQGRKSSHKERQGRKKKEVLLCVLCALGVLCVSSYACLLYTSDAADERSSVDLGGRRIIKKKNSRI